MSARDSQTKSDDEHFFGAKGPGEELLMLVILGGIVMLIISRLPTAGSRFVDWLISRGVLIGPSADPLVIIPGTSGAGLDLSRALILYGFLAVIAALSAHSIWYRIRSWQAGRDG